MPPDGRYPFCPCGNRRKCFAPGRVLMYNQCDRRHHAAREAGNGTDSILQKMRPGSGAGGDLPPLRNPAGEKCRACRVVRGTHAGEGLDVLEQRDARAAARGAGHPGAGAGPGGGQRRNRRSGADDDFRFPADPADPAGGSPAGGICRPATAGKGIVGFCGGQPGNP